METYPTVQERESSNVQLVPSNLPRETGRINDEKMDDDIDPHDQINHDEEDFDDDVFGVLPTLQAPYSNENLFLYQKIHVQRMLSVTYRNYVVQDLSHLGLGKTHTALALYLERRMIDPDLKLLVVCPCSVISKWEAICQENHVGQDYLLGIFSYAKITGQKNSNISTPILRRKDTERKEIQHRKNPFTGVKEAHTQIMRETIFSLSTQTRELLLHCGLFVVFDEYHAMKRGVSARSKMCRPLSEAIRNDPLLRSKVLLISGTPVDKEEQAITFFRTVAVLSRPKIINFNVGTRRYEGDDGLEQIESFCFHVLGLKDYGRVQHAMNRIYQHEMAGCTHGDEFQMLRKNSAKYCYLLYLKLFKWISCEMRVADGVDCDRLAAGRVHKLNMYCENIGVNKDALAEALYDLRTAVRYDPKRGTVQMEGCSFGKITTALVKIEFCKCPTFERLARQILGENRENQVVITLNYNAAMDYLIERLGDLRPSVLRGCVSKKERCRIIGQFQEDNPNCRLLLCNLQVIKEGIDLDNIHETKRYRFSLVSPNYHAISLHQHAYRYVRSKSTTNALVLMIFQKGLSEFGVLNALRRKGLTMSEVQQSHREYGVTFLNENKHFDEPLPHVVVDLAEEEKEAEELKPSFSFVEVLLDLDAHGGNSRFTVDEVAN